MSTTVGTVEYLVSIDTNTLKGQLRAVDKEVGGLADTSEVTSKRSNRAFESIAKVGIAGIAAAAVTAGIMITKNIGNAISRVDTLNNFPKVMTNLGYGADESTNAIKMLDKGVQGLPTSLDSIASAMQNIAPSSKSLDYASKLTLALNNALVAGGKPAEQQATAMEQFSQAIAKGKPDLIEWRSIATAMPGQMKQLANSLGYQQWQDMAQAVTDGVLPFSKVQDAIIGLNEKGLGQFPSFAEQAKNSAGGLQTGIANMNTAITRGVAKIIEAIGSEKITQSLSTIGSSFETALKWVAAFINFVDRNSTFLMPIIVAVTTIIGLLTAWFVATKVLAAAQAVLNAVMMANPIGLIIIGIVALVAAIVWLWNNVEGFRNFFTNIWQGIKNVIDTFWQGVKDVVAGVLEWIKSNWATILPILTGPFGLAVAIIVKNFDTIRNAVMAVYNWIRGAFSTIADIGTSILRGAVNSVLGFAENTINGFIRLINGAIGAINKIPGVNIGSIGELRIPRLAKGGIIPSTPGGVLANIGEGGEAEAVIPLSKLDDLLASNATGKGSETQYNIGTINIANDADGEKWLRKLTRNDQIISRGLIPGVNNVT